jgi:hypothetical protein
MCKSLLIILLLVASAHAAELKLPELLVMQNGEKVTTAEQWPKRRAELLELLRTNEYGRAPVGRPESLSFTTTNTEPKAMDGKATLKQIKIAYKGPGGEGAINLVLFVPNDAPKPAPAFVLICNRPPEKNIDPTRVEKSPFWPAEQVIARGYAVAAFFNGDVDADKHDGFKDGVHGIFDKKDQPRAPDAWATIAAWAWGASRTMDYFETDKDIDTKRVAVIGHSRGGKTALWCGAEDERFALAISNDSGCSGAAIARNKKGERVEKINTAFPHWFCENYKKWNGKEDEMPFDQHMLVALMAPRLVCVASATEDTWAHPENEFLACVHASPAWELFKLKGIGTDKFPAPESPINDGKVGYHLRTGKHDLTEYDWKCYMDFADKHLKK